MDDCDWIVSWNKFQCIRYLIVLREPYVLQPYVVFLSVIHITSTTVLEYPDVLVTVVSDIVVVVCWPLVVVDSNFSVVDVAAAVSVTTTSGGGLVWELNIL